MLQSVSLAYFNGCSSSWTFWSTPWFLGNTLQHETNFLLLFYFAFSTGAAVSTFSTFCWMQCDLRCTYRSYHCGIVFISIQLEETVFFVVPKAIIYHIMIFGSFCIVLLNPLSVMQSWIRLLTTLDFNVTIKSQFLALLVHITASCDSSTFIRVGPCGDSACLYNASATVSNSPDISAMMKSIFPNCSSRLAWCAENF